MFKLFGSWPGCRALIAVLAGSAQQARAQAEQVKPYVLLLFDTRAACANHACHGGDYGTVDNSAECPGSDVSCTTCSVFGCGDGLANDMKILKVKAGASEVVSAFGEVVFGLSRFHQIAGTFRQQLLAGEAWEGGGAVAGDWRADAMGTAGQPRRRPGRLLRHQPDPDPALDEQLQGLPQPGHLRQPSAAADHLRPAAASAARLRRRLRLRASGSGNTPLAGSLYDVRPSFLTGGSASSPTTAMAACRPYRVILLTDGQNNCDGDPVTAGDRAANGLANTRGKSIPVHVDRLRRHLAQALPRSDRQRRRHRLGGGGGQRGEPGAGDGQHHLGEHPDARSATARTTTATGSATRTGPRCGGDRRRPAPTSTRPRPAPPGSGVCQRTGLYRCKADG